MCRACNNTIEAQHHVLKECPVLHPYGKPNTNEMDPFSNNMNVLKETAKNIEYTLNELDSIGSMGTRPAISVLTPANMQ